MTHNRPHASVRHRSLSWLRVASVVLAATVTLTACAGQIQGEASVENAPNANIQVTGDSNDQFDTTVKNALSDIMAFWKINYPKVSGGKPLEPLKGGLFSVDGAEVASTKTVSGPAGEEGCIKEDPSFIVDNGAFCLLDDSIAWDRSEMHLFAQLGKHYGDLMVALVFAHEFGHSISYRLGVFKDRPKTILTESQADCAAGAWAASALAHQAPHFRTVTPQKLDDALEGYLNGRDSVPGTIDEISHGNGFDRLSALADGIDKGVTYCFSKNYFNRTFTERPFSSPQDYNSGGNASYSDTTDPAGLLVKDFNRFWTEKAKSIGKTFQPVKIAEAAHPACGSTSTSEFGYCPDDNTVYYSDDFANAAYDSLPGIEADKSSGDVTLVFNQPADFALGELFAIGWGMAVRHQLFDRSVEDEDALLSAVCYSGAYAKDVNLATDPDVNTPAQRDLLLSPADLDEAVSALLDEAGQDKAYGSRGSTGLDRIQSFVKGYKQSLSSC